VEQGQDTAAADRARRSLSSVLPLAALILMLALACALATGHPPPGGLSVACVALPLLTLIACISPPPIALAAALVGGAGVAWGSDGALPPEVRIERGLAAAGAGLAIALVVMWHRQRSERAMRSAARLVEHRRSHEAMRAQEEMLNDLLGRCAIAQQGLGRDGRIRWVNAIGLELLGEQAATCLGRHVGEYIADPVQAGELAQLIAHAAEPQSRTVRLRGRGGEVRTVLFTIYPPGQGGADPVTRCLIHDISVTARMETTLRDSREQLTLALAAAALGTWHCELPLGGRLAFDAQCRAHFGLEPAEEVGFPLLDERIHPDDRAMVLAAFARTVQERTPLDLDVRTRASGGEVRWLRMIGRVNADRQDAPGRLDGITIDQTARKSAELALAVQAGELARSNAELEQFAYIASHDLQEPLRMIISYLQILEARYGALFDDKARSYFAFVSGGASRMRALINALLEYSRIGSQPVAMQVIDAAIPLRDALANLDALISTTRVRLHYAGLPVVRADRVQLAQLFQNLISNALKFRSAHPPEVRITARDGGSCWIFAVVDNGIGIDPQHKDRIFKIFQRLHADEQYPGSGIGLATCRKIVERHHGRIEVDSRLGEGAVFTFTLAKA
jgi:signal transduction histidine kinase